jgi:hypothetical protein
MAKNDEAARREMKAARRELDDVHEAELKAAKREKRKPQETPAYWRANDRVIAAEKNVPWWRR